MGQVPRTRTASENSTDKTIALWAYPWDESSKEDQDTSIRFREFNIQWFADPIYFGDYPQSMKD
jgi:beta-glucosidase/6-phospho-beta-glucosidase/beta-galactosidase